jgi:hypothetical protein
MSRPVENQVDLIQILTKVLELATPACKDVPYRLVGTAAALIRGVQIPCGDVDLLFKERSGVDAFASALSDFPCITPAIYLEQARQYFTEIDVQGVEIELSTVEWEMDSDGVECIGPGSWTHFDWLSCGEYTVPAVVLELRLVTELVRNRPDRFNPIIAYLRAHGCDVELVRRGLAAGGAPPAWVEKVINQLPL